MARVRPLRPVYCLVFRKPPLRDQNHSDTVFFENPAAVAVETPPLISRPHSSSAHHGADRPSVVLQRQSHLTRLPYMLLSLYRRNTLRMANIVPYSCTSARYSRVSGKSAVGRLQIVSPKKNKRLPSFDLQVIKGLMSNSYACCRAICRMPMGEVAQSAPVYRPYKP